MTKALEMAGGVALVAVLAAGCGSGVGSQPTDPALTHEIPSFEISDLGPGVAHQRFIAFGDMGTGRAGQFEVAAAMVDRASRDGLDFVLTLGDNFYGDGVASATDPQWETKFERPYADPALDVPIYPSLGNHDHKGDPDAQIEYSGRNPNWMMPDRYYTFTRVLDDGTKVQFFAIDTTPMHDLFGDASAQLAWLDQTLADSDARWKIVFGHHPLYSHGAHGSDRVLIRTLEPVFSSRGVDVYFAGHDHTLEMLKPVSGVHYVVSGAGGGADKAYSISWTDDAYYAATLGGFAYMRISRNELVIEFVRMDAMTQYAHTLRKP